jgi:prevent-host-death family protein
VGAPSGLARSSDSKPHAETAVGGSVEVHATNAVFCFGVRFNKSKLNHFTSGHATESKLDHSGQLEDLPCSSAMFTEFGMRGRQKTRRVREHVSLYEAKTRLSELVEQAAAGREIVIAKSGKPKARLVPLAPKDTRRRRRPGLGKGRGIWIAPDFDAPLPPELFRWFTGESG